MTTISQLLGFGKSRVLTLHCMANNFDKFVPIPSERFIPGKRSAAFLGFHDTLMMIAWEKSAVRYENIPASIFLDFRGLSKDSVQEGRNEAKDLKLIDFVLTNGTYTYWLLDETGKPRPPKQGAHSKGVWKYTPESWSRMMAKGRELLLLKQAQVLMDPSGKSRGVDTQKPPRKPSGKSRGVKPNPPVFPEPPSGFSGPPPQQVADVSVACEAASPLKRLSEVKTLCEVGFDSAAASFKPPSAAQIGFPAQPGKKPAEPAKKRTREELRAAVKADPNLVVIKRLQEKFGARTVAIIDKRTEAR